MESTIFNVINGAWELETTTLTDTKITHTGSDGTIQEILVDTNELDDLFSLLHTLNEKPCQY